MPYIPDINNLQAPVLSGIQDEASGDLQSYYNSQGNALLRAQHAQAMAQYETVRRQRDAIDAEEDAKAQEELASRNEASAARQNAAAMRPRQNARAGGTRYTRRGMWTPGGSGLDRVNSQSRVAARKKARYAQANQQLAQGAGGGGGWTLPSPFMPTFTIYH